MYIKHFFRKVIAARELSPQKKLVVKLVTWVVAILIWLGVLVSGLWVLDKYIELSPAHADLESRVSALESKSR